jgi:hypothetical protein
MLDALAMFAKIVDREAIASSEIKAAVVQAPARTSRQQQSHFNEIGLLKMGGQ